jgi:glutaminyl-tRNA synthetase
MKPTPTFPLVTRFPPEPNGYLHLGHAKSILINFGLNQQHSHDGTLRTNVRFDDTNPVKESEEFAKSIIEDVSWLVGPDYFDGKTTSTSQHFNYLEECAEYLISQSLAYVDKSDKETIREMRGTLTKPGVPSPYRDTSPSENLELFKKMKSGE